MLSHDQIRAYAIGLCLSTNKYAQALIGKILGIGRNSAGEMLDYAKENEDFFRKLALKMFKHIKYLKISIDDTFLLKQFAQLSRDCKGNYIPTEKMEKMSARCLAAAIVSEALYLPIFIQLFDYSNPLYNTPKWKLAMILRIVEVAQEMFPDAVITYVADGGFYSNEIIKELAARNIRFTCRIACNRKVVVGNELKNINEIPELQIYGRIQERTIFAIRAGVPVYISAIKREDHNGDVSVIYLVSTYEAKYQFYRKLYQLRWKIEKIFRTTKHYLYLAKSQALKEGRQYGHVTAVFLAYSFAAIYAYKNKLKNPEAALREVKRLGLEEFRSIVESYFA